MRGVPSSSMLLATDAARESCTSRALLGPDCALLDRLLVDASALPADLATSLEERGCGDTPPDGGLGYSPLILIVRGLGGRPPVRLGS